MTPVIEVFSTFAKDVFVTETGQIIKEQQGGPATFIQQTLQALGAEFQINTADEVVVEILLADQSEFGRIKRSPKRNLIRPRQANSVLLVSTLLDEWSLPQTSQQIFLDVQGYVRDGKVFGGRKSMIVDPQVEPALICVKAEQEEAKCLSADFLEKQKNKQLAITKGSEGVELYISGRRYDIPAIPISDLHDTVGAGDTWFAAYVAYQLKGEDYISSAGLASRFVSQFLQRKK